MNHPCPPWTKKIYIWTKMITRSHLRLSNIYCQKTLAIAVRKGRIDSCSQIVFTCLNMPTFSVAYSPAKPFWTDRQRLHVSACWQASYLERHGQSVGKPTDAQTIASRFIRQWLFNLQKEDYLNRICKDRDGVRTLLKSGVELI